jgi:hypothetical protein
MSEELLELEEVDTEITYGVPEGIPVGHFAKAAVEAGVSYAHVAAFTGVGAAALMARSGAALWKTPKRTGGEAIVGSSRAYVVMKRLAYEMKAEIVLENAEIQDRMDMLDAIEGKLSPEEVEVLIERLSVRHRLKMIDTLMGKVGEAKSLTLRNMNDLKGADEMLRRSLGMAEKPQKAAVNIQVLGGGVKVVEASPQKVVRNLPHAPKVDDI